MRKAVKWIAVLALLAMIVYMGSVISDKQQLQSGILRLHVLANSDSATDQAVKLQVRDAVLAEVEEITAQAKSKAEAEAALSSNLNRLERAANARLDELGVSHRASVTLGKEEYPIRHYDTFTLPAGVYDSLRVSIGSAEGKNWWCVVFPGLCIPAASEDVADAAAGAGFSDSVSGAITGQPKYEVRFYLLELLGRLENFFHKG